MNRRSAESIFYNSSFLYRAICIQYLEVANMCDTESRIKCATRYLAKGERAVVK